MTDRVTALTVVLEKDMREDDVEHLVNAILWMRYVARVEKRVLTDKETVRMQVASELSMEIYKTAEEVLFKHGSGRD